MGRLEEFLSRPKEQVIEINLKLIERIKDKIISLHGEEHYRKLTAKIKSDYFDGGDDSSEGDSESFEDNAAKS